MHIGFCSYCNVKYSQDNYEEFLIEIKRDEKWIIRKMSVCKNCYMRLDDKMVEKILEGEKEYVSQMIRNDITKTSEQKLESIQNWRNTKLIKWGRNMDELNSK